MLEFNQKRKISIPDEWPVTTTLVIDDVPSKVAFDALLNKLEGREEMSEEKIAEMMAAIMREGEIPHIDFLNFVKSFYSEERKECFDEMKDPNDLDFPTIRR